MDRLHQIAALLILAALPGCTLLHTGGANGGSLGCYAAGSTGSVVCDEIKKYTFLLPKWITETDWRNRDVSVQTYSFPITKIEQQDWKDRGHFLPLNASCSPSLIGTADLEEFSGTNGKTVWGRIGVTNVYDDYDDAVCAPPIAYPSTSDEKAAAWRGEFRTERAAYALCSEKDGKTVVICISQMQDDPKLAQEIFETFRWVE